MGGIFISYRREDSIAYAGRLYDHLADQFGEDRIFMDIDTMKVGLDFVEQIEKAVHDCDLLIAVIGKTWVQIKDEEGHRRLDNPEDFVRVEIQAALERNIPVVPLLIGGAEMPRASELPEGLAKLTRRHAMKMSDERYRADAARLMEQIKGYISEGSPTIAPELRSKETVHTLRSGKQGLQPPEGKVLVPKGPFLYGDERVRETIPHDF